MRHPDYFCISVPFVRGREKYGSEIFSPLLTMSFLKGHQRRDDHMRCREQECGKHRVRREEESRRHQQFMEMMAMVATHALKKKSPDFN